jgi:UDP-glucose 4-epimerase
MATSLYLDKKTVLVTGGTGSMGKTFVRRVLSGEMGTPKKIIILSRDEAKQHYMRLDYLHKTQGTEEIAYKNFLNLVEFRLGDIRDYGTVCSALKGVDVVVNAAALKQVPACEYFPEQAIFTNCLGPANIVRALREHDYSVETVVGISTDKAAKPVNVMGMTKSLNERIFISANILVPKTRFVCVRYGNVLASRGSVIPLFHDQIRNGGPITITDNKMTRFLLSLDQAIDVVFTALIHARRGETVIPISPTASMLNIAKALIGKKKVKIEVTGIRPGEKYHEALVGEEEAPRTYKKGDYYFISPMLPELQESTAGLKFGVLKGEYTSEKDVLNLDETVKLLKANHLMIDQVSFGTQNNELLR